MQLEDLLGKTVDFYGVDCNRFCVQIDGDERRAFEVVEDPDDGCRSALDEIKEVSVDAGIFFGQPIARVTVLPDSELRGFKLVDATTEHPWLRMGTHDWDDYYPCFVFRYDPARGE